MAEQNDRPRARRDGRDRLQQTDEVRAADKPLERPEHLAIALFGGGPLDPEQLERAYRELADHQRVIAAAGGR